LPPLRAINPAISQPMDAVVQKAMGVRAQERFQSAAEMRQALGARVAPTAPVYTPTMTQPAPRYTPPVSPSPVSPRPVHSTSSNWGAILTGLVGLMIAGFLFVGAVAVLMRPAPTAVPTAAPLPTAPMVLVPAGDFTMGSIHYDNEKPIHTVYLDAFWIDKYEVTNALYKKCVDAGKCTLPKETQSYTHNSYFGNAQFDNYPVIYVSWERAKIYCEWAGKRLPTEAEWEKAARGTDGRVYPWGNSFDKNLLNSFEGGKGVTTVVGSYPGGASPYGIMDLSGNVWEWVADWYGSYPSGLQRNPTGPSSGQSRVLRGGACFDNSSNARAANRNLGGSTYSNADVGFRCARSP
jgi:serine/threonine-protein kinase